jgi:predicted O-linked N-acetylglucosamine transferase (SPINDLY family)
MMADYFQALLQEAVTLHQAGKLAEARAAYLEILKAQPRNADALHLLGVIAHQMGDHEQAVALIGQAIALHPGNAAQYQNIALALKALQRWDEALAQYGKAIAIKPDYADAHSNRGALLQELGRLDEALASYDQALAFHPAFAEAWNNRGAVLHALKQPDAALASYGHALQLSPAFAAAHANRGAVLHDMGKLEDALASYDQALALNPGFAEGWNKRGAVLRDLERLDEALADLDKAITLQPGMAEAHVNRAPILRDLKRPEEALASYAAAMARKPETPFLTGLFLSAKMLLCDWSGLEQELADCVAAVRAGKQVATPFVLLGLVDDPLLHRQAAEIYCAARHPQSSALGPLVASASEDKMADGKIRIGYYSADFHNHATSYLMAELFESHDPEKFELTAFSFGPDSQGEMRQRIAGAFGEFLEIRGLGDREIAQLSRQRGIDIAVDLKGYTKDARPGIFAEGCASIQAHYIGYPGTMGAPFMDYVIADGTVIPAGQEGAYSEKILRLPHSYQANDSRRKISDTKMTRQEFGLPENGFVFCCFNKNTKLVPEIFEAWLRILKAVEGSVLWLLMDDAAAAENLRRAASAGGLDPMRLVFAGRVPLDEHLARHRLADLFLDSWPYNAHTTASDALWAGLPLLTREGKAFAGRVAASLLKSLELPELITTSLVDYASLAINLARDPAKLAAIRTKLAKTRLSAPLFDGKRLARHLEAGYEIMHSRHKAGLEPQHIDVLP